MKLPVILPGARIRCFVGQTNKRFWTGTVAHVELARGRSTLRWFVVKPDGPLPPVRKFEGPPVNPFTAAQLADGVAVSARQVAGIIAGGDA